MDNKIDIKQVEARKVEIETKFNELNDRKILLVEQVKIIGEAMKQITNEQLTLQGAYAEVCNVLGLDPKDTKNLTIKPKSDEEKTKN